MKKRHFFALTLLCALCLSLLCGCHGAKGLKEFEMPESFDERVSTTALSPAALTSAKAFSIRSASWYCSRHMGVIPERTRSIYAWMYLFIPDRRQNHQGGGSSP